MEPNIVCNPVYPQTMRARILPKIIIPYFFFWMAALWKYLVYFL